MRQFDAGADRVKRGLPAQPRIVLANGKRPCRGCGAELPKLRHAWCSDGCRDTHYMALSTFARRKVYARDKGICTLCGCDAAFLQRIVRRLKRSDAREGMLALRVAWGLNTEYWNLWSIPNGWEADHIVPLAEGGTNDLSNYRTLCVPCHKAETRALAGRLAAKRRTQERLPL